MRINYQTPCVTEKLGEIRSFVAKQLEQTNLSDNEKNQVILAIDEACANAIIHGNHCDRSRQLQVELEISEDKISIEICDVGDYRPNEVNWATRDISQNIREKRKGGMGLLLMHRIMDTVRYYNKGEVNVCYLTKQLK